VRIAFRRLPQPILGLISPEDNDIKVLHAPVNIANQPWGLSRQERILGVKSEVVVNYATQFRFASDICLGEYGRRSIRDVTRRLWFGLSAPLRYDVLHYYFGRSLLCWDDYGPPNRLWYADLKLARRCHRKIFMTLQGCDARLAYRSNDANTYTPCRDGHCPNFPGCMQGLDAQRMQLVETILPLCDRVLYLNPELGFYVPEGVFLPYTSVDVENIHPVPPKAEGRVKILHAPTDAGVKGTQYILDAVEMLRLDYDIEFVLIQNMVHEEALKTYREADIIVDQLLAGWYGALAVEGMALGKVVVCYIRDEDLRFIPLPMKEELPLFNACPDDLAQRLAEAIDRRREWPEWSERAVNFVRKWHNPRLIARAMIEAYRDPGSGFDLQRAVRRL
jgi:hypothetical protein